MSFQEDELQDYKNDLKKDLELRESSIKDGEELDKNIHKRMKAGEIGLSRGIDNHIGLIMFLTAVIFTFLALYFIFGVIPDRIES
tara:strand:+ start:43 stop:297 length:255 start_codon:yes stop_codon:yes gene_type:complete